MGKRIELWGCGALGSWIAEQVARAGAAAITLRDPGYVSHGILVRQNYDESDVGAPKVHGLAKRIAAIVDNIEVTPAHGPAQLAFASETAPDLIIDCTVNTAVAAALNERQRDGRVTCPVLQLATDHATATLAVLTITSGTTSTTTNDIDKRLQATAHNDTRLEPFRTFWDTDDHPTLTPTLGCSVPTFRGSAADAMAVAATAVSLSGHALTRSVACGYLYAAAHSSLDVPARTGIIIE
jgi:molybdopterin/thiamine biosynthesis adenylyltransferase